MPLWIPITLCAACLQVVRTGLQKSLKSGVDDYSATWARYIFALPFTPLILIGIVWFDGALPAANTTFFLYCLIGGITQIVATVMLLALFSRRNFAVSTTFAKTEGIQIALLGLLLFDEPMSLLGGCGVVLGGLSVFMMAPKQWRAGLPVILMGLGAGFFFAITVWCIRQSYGQVQTDNPFIGAACTLVTMIVLQSFLLWLFLLGRKTDLSALWNNRRPALLVGITGLLGSFCWFTAFVLINPAYVKTLAQIELPLAFLVSRAAFREKPGGWEIAGMVAAMLAGILVIFA